MAFITPKELETHLYKENIEAISREDETILTAAIDAALQEAYGYLGAYDRQKDFRGHREPKKRPPTHFCKGHSRVAFREPMQCRY